MRASLILSSLILMLGLCVSPALAQGPGPGPDGQTPPIIQNNGGGQHQEFGPQGGQPGSGNEPQHAQPHQNMGNSPNPGQGNQHNAPPQNHAEPGPDQHQPQHPQEPQPAPPADPHPAPQHEQPTLSLGNLQIILDLGH